MEDINKKSKQIERITMIVGITGKSGSGKSTIANFVRELGYEVIDVDKIHKEVKLDNYTKIEEIYVKHGLKIDNYFEMVDIFFRNQIIRNEVNKILFPETIKRIPIKKTDKLIFLDAPLLFDMGLNLRCDKVWYVYCRKFTNIQRIMQRNNVSFEKAVERYNAIDFPHDEKFVYDVLINTEYKADNMIKGVIKDYEECNLRWKL